MPPMNDPDEGGSGLRCSRCGAPNASRCGGCVGAPSYDDNTTPGRSYCGPVCQKSAWEQHKVECKGWKARKRLLTIVALLEAAIASVRKMAYPLALRAVKRGETGTIVLESCAEDKSWRPRSYHRPLPGDMVSLQNDSELLKPVSLHMSGFEAMVYLRDFVQGMLRGMSATFMEVELVPTNHKANISSDLNTPCGGAQVHHIYKVTMGNGELWAVDATGAQYGHTDLLLPWSIYIKERSTAIKGQWDLGFFRSQLSATSPRTPMPANVAQIRAVLGKLDLQSALSQDDFGGTLQKLLRLSPTNFSSTVKQFANKVQMQLSPPAELCTIKPTAGKGKGMFAVRDIAKGTRVLSEAPIFKVASRGLGLVESEEAINCSVKLLSTEERRDFFDLHNCHGALLPRALGIAQTNALPLGSDATEGGIFIEASRINHSCRHNSQNTWNTNRGELTIHVLRDVSEGEEITIHYLEGSMNHAARQSRLKESFGFACACELCSLPAPLRRHSDDRLDKMTQLDARLGDGAALMSAPLAQLRLAHSMKRLMDEEGIADARVPRLYYDALQIAAAHSDEARARVFAERACAERVVMEGADSPEVQRLRRLAEQPSAHRLYGSTKKWKRKAADVPRDLGAEEFEKWLWRSSGP